jgi:hypothetical protein
MACQGLKFIRCEFITFASICLPSRAYLFFIGIQGRSNRTLFHCAWIDPGR